MKVFTKRKQEANPVADAKILLRTINKLRGYALVPRGVYRFKTMEEADKWMLEEMIKTHVPRKSKML